MYLLTAANPKMQKSTKYGYLSFILHLAPHTLSGYNVCPASSVACRSLCLNTAGRGRFLRTQLARVRRTKLFFENRSVFMWQLTRDIEAGIRKANRLGLEPCFRLNGTSDIRWETVPVVYRDTTYSNIMTAFPHVQFYDYTAISNRRNLPANYHLTFSLKENNLTAAEQALQNNMSVAVVFHSFPAAFLGRDVVNGDLHDLRFLDVPGCIVGLKAKGKAKKTKSTFIK